MTRNLVNKASLEEPIILWSRTTCNAQEHSAHIGHSVVASSAEEAVARSDMIWSCLSDEEAVNQVFGILLEKDLRGKIFVECSTVTPEASNKLAAKVIAAGAEFVSMPVFGEPSMAAAGVLTCVPAGKVESVAKVKPYLIGVLGRAVIDFGGQEAGNASLLKVIGNVFIVNMIETLSEGHVLAEKTGLGVENLEKFLQVVFPAPYMIYSKRMRSGAYYKAEPIVNIAMAKNVASHVMDLARASGTNLPAYEAACKHMDAVQCHIGKAGDISGIYGALRMESGLAYENDEMFSSSSSKRWQTRAGNDQFSKEARVRGLKSRAAFKLLEINDKYKVFKAGQTVVDLGYAPGSWSQVAVDRTSPNGRVIGIDVIPAQPPKGVSTIQGNFLSHDVQEAVKDLLRESSKRRTMGNILEDSGYEQSGTHDKLEEVSLDQPEIEHEAQRSLEQYRSHAAKKNSDESEGRVVDIVLSDMSEPWEQTTGFWLKSLSNPYRRMMNTSGMNFRDHAGSMDLCNAALNFSYDTLRTGGHFVCKFYQGAEEKAFEARLKALFAKVHREKPESSRSESKEAYFVALRRKGDTRKEDVFNDT
ncbi:2' O-ribose methyltransferase [Xylographa trunciseda]|nr:2' O-ribose methyltransferase [Xylographa trunciseda]